LARLASSARFLGGAEFVEQLASFTDIDPATDDALNFTDGVAVRQDPVVDRQFFSANMQGAVQDQRVALGHHALIVGMVLSRLDGEGCADLDRAFTYHVLALDVERLQVTVVAGLQQPLVVTYVDRVRGFIDQGAHELELIIEGALGHFPVLDLAAHVRVPAQGNQQQQAGPDDDARNQLVIVAPVTVRGGGITAPTTVDHAEFVRGDAEQRLVENRAELGGAAGSRQPEGGRHRANAEADLDLVLKYLRGQEVIGDHQGYSPRPLHGLVPAVRLT